MKKITIEEVNDRLENGDDVQFVDSRAPHAWDEAKTKAAGAIRIPPDEAQKHTGELNRDDFIVTYCT